MRVVISEFISLDGVVQAPGGADEDPSGGFRHGGWSMPYFDPEVMGATFDSTLADADALLYGRRTYQVMAGAWPERAGDPFADRINAIPKYVASRTLGQGDLTWTNSTLLAGDAIEAVRELRSREGGGVLMMGSPNLAAQLVANDLVDEYKVMITPILLGGGKSIFPTDGAARPLELVSVTQAATGVLVCTYRAKRS